MTMRSMRAAVGLSVVALLLAACAGTAPPSISSLDLAAFSPPEAPNVNRADYRIRPGDTIEIRFYYHPDHNVDNMIVQPDGTITMPLLGQVPATRRTIKQLTEELTELYKKFYQPATIANAITITPLKVNTKLNDILNTVDRRQGFGGEAKA